VSAQPPSQPQISADGKFYWDGTAWRPLPAQQPQQQPSHRGRNFALGCLGLIAVVILIGVIGNGSKNQPTLKWDFSGRAIRTATVGGTDAFQITVTNNGPAASDLILYVNAKDNWLKHHVITKSEGCTLNKNLERLECGSFAAGETRIVNVEGSPKDAGNFDFEVDVADQEGSQLSYPDKAAWVWSETVTL
jgi:hypothetical protein